MQWKFSIISEHNSVFSDVDSRTRGHVDAVDTRRRGWGGAVDPALSSPLTESTRVTAAGAGPAAAGQPLRPFSGTLY